MEAMDMVGEEGERVMIEDMMYVKCNLCVNMKGTKNKGEGKGKKGTKKGKTREFIYEKKMSRRRIKVSENVN